MWNFGKFCIFFCLMLICIRKLAYEDNVQIMCYEKTRFRTYLTVFTTFLSLFSFIGQKCYFQTFDVTDLGTCRSDFKSGMTFLSQGQELYCVKKSNQSKHSLSVLRHCHLLFLIMRRTGIDNSIRNTRPTIVTSLTDPFLIAWGQFEKIVHFVTSFCRLAWWQIWV